MYLSVNINNSPSLRCGSIRWSIARFICHVSRSDTMEQWSDTRIWRSCLVSLWYDTQWSCILTRRFVEGRVFRGIWRQFLILTRKIVNFDDSSYFGINNVYNLRNEWFWFLTWIRWWWSMGITSFTRWFNGRNESRRIESRLWRNYGITQISTDQSFQSICYQSQVWRNRDIDWERKEVR